METKLIVEVDGATPVNLLAEASGLSKTRIKTVMTRGAVWLTRSGKQRRLRRAKSSLKAGDELAIYYNAAIIDTAPPEPQKLADEGDWSAWFKPTGLLSSGSRFGDHCAINRWVEQHENRPVFLVHRLDAQTEGIMLLAHTRGAAAKLSQAFSARKVSKIYTAEVQGEFPPEPITCSEPVDGTEARTEFNLILHAEASSLVSCRPITGRKHQVRVHLAWLGYPLTGDHLYGATERGRFRLTATALTFPCPVTGELRELELPAHLNQFASTREDDGINLTTAPCSQIGSTTKPDSQ